VSLNNASRFALTARNKRASADHAARELVKATDIADQPDRSSLHVTHFSVCGVAKTTDTGARRPDLGEIDEELVGKSASDSPTIRCVARFAVR
jgi:hypothetical protein